MITKPALDRLYCRYNRRKYVHPDPLEFLYNYPDLHDREIAGLIASSLAYGRVAQILKSVRRILDKMGPHPRTFIEKTSPARMARIFDGFKHRFTTDEEIVSLLTGVARVIKQHGSLNECFVACMQPEDETVMPALGRFAAEINCCGNYLIPSASRGSACKRLNLYLRWMVRKDDVDPGGWKGVPKSKLVVPIDTHMANIGRTLKLTNRKSCGLHMALEITGSFLKFSPDDPVKYDFSLTRFGIHPDMNMKTLLDQYA